ncbi:MAG TPA: hypothetical protein VGE69_00940 [Pseudomonadales bacterium]
MQFTIRNAIKSLAPVEGLNDVIVQLQVTATHSVGEASASQDYTFNLLPPDPQTFIPLGDVTSEETMLGWLNEALGVNGAMSAAEVESELEAIIAAQAQAPQVTSVGLPWQE